MLKYSTDGRVCFNSENHTYTLDGWKNLPSATTVLKKYKEEKDFRVLAAEYAMNHGYESKEAVLEEWQAITDEGTRIHAIIEHFYNTGEIPRRAESKKEYQAIRFIHDYFVSGKLIPYACEEILYNECIAGQCDNKSRNTKGKNFILDWKTNKKITQKSYDKYMKHPFSVYPDVNYWHYCLQVNIYKKLSPEPIEGAYIVHLTEEDYVLYKTPHIEIPDEILYYKK